MEYNNKEYNNKLRCVILPKDANVENFEEIEIDISSDAEVRVKQFGMLSELYYLYAKHNIFTHYDINKTYEEKKIPALDYIDEIYENILFLRFIYYDVVIQKNKDLIGFIDILEYIFRFIVIDGKRPDKLIKGELVLLSKIYSLDESVTQDLNSAIDDYYNRYKSNITDIYFLNTYLKIIDCFRKTEYKKLIDSIKYLVIIRYINKTIYKEQLNLILDIEDTINKSNRTIQYINDIITKLQESIVLIVKKRNGYVIDNNVDYIIYEQIKEYIQKIPKDYKKRYKKNGDKCIAIAETNGNNRYISFSGSKFVEDELKNEFIKIVNTNYKVAYLEDSVRYYYNDKEYVDYNKIKENSNKFKQDDRDLLINRSCSCCERKILNELNTIKETNNVKIFVKKPPCQICKWAIDDILTNYKVYYKYTTRDDDKIIKLVGNI